VDPERNADTPPGRPQAAGGAPSPPAPRRPRPDTKGKTRRKTRSDKEYDEVIDFVVLLLNRRQTKGFIKKAVNNQFFRPAGTTGSWQPGCGWGVTPRTIESYLARAQKRIVDATKKKPEWHKLRALNFYESVVAGPDAEMGERLRAQERIDRLLGLESPTEHHQSGKGGGRIGIAVTDIVIEHHGPGHDAPAADSPADQPPADRDDGGQGGRPVPPGQVAGLDVHA
jgi:hypothetical protein